MTDEMVCPNLDKNYGILERLSLCSRVGSDLCQHLSIDTAIWDWRVVYPDLSEGDFFEEKMEINNELNILHNKVTKEEIGKPLFYQTVHGCKLDLTYWHRGNYHVVLVESSRGTTFTGLINLHRGGQPLFLVYIDGYVATPQGPSWDAPQGGDLDEEIPF